MLRLVSTLANLAAGYQGMCSSKSKLKASVYWWTCSQFWKLNQVQLFRDQNERKPIRLLLFNARACDRTGSHDQIHWSGNQPLVNLHTYIIHTSFFRCSPRGFSATCLQQMQGSVVEGLSQTATSGSQCFIVWDIKLCPQLTVHNTSISLLLSTSVWVLLSPPIERRETRPTA